MSWIRNRINLNKLKKWFLYLLYLSLSCAVIIEILFRFLPVSDVYKLQDTNKASPYAHFLPNQLNTRQTGFDFSHVVEKRTNNYGYVTDTSFSKKRDFSKKRFSVIGDSYVEASHVYNKDTFHALLSNQFKESEFYPVGVYGAPLSQYLAFAKFSEFEFNPDKFIFVIIRNDFDESLLEINQKPSFHHYDDDMSLVLVDYKGSISRKILRNLAFIRYLYLDLKLHVQFKRLFNKLTGGNEIDAKIEKINRQKNERVITHFLEDLSNIVKGKEVLFVLDGDREKITSNGTKTNSGLITHSYEYFQQKAIFYPNFKILDMHPIFSNHYNVNKQKFSWEYDYHWNELGHKTVFEAISDSGFIND